MSSAEYLEIISGALVLLAGGGAVCRSGVTTFGLGAVAHCVIAAGCVIAGRCVIADGKRA